MASGQWRAVTISFSNSATSHWLRTTAVKISPATPPIRLIAVDIDGTLLNSQFRVSEKDLKALQRANQEAIEVILVPRPRVTLSLCRSPSNLDSTCG